MFLEPYKVYVQVDSENRIAAINSSAFIDNTESWILIDSGHGDKYHHAQGHYFPQSIMDERGIWRYKLIDGKVQERTQEEMDADYAPNEETPSQLDRIEAQALYTALLTDTLIEEV